MSVGRRTLGTAGRVRGLCMGSRLGILGVGVLVRILGGRVERRGYWRDVNTRLDVLGEGVRG
jgi:hypothetical protein